MSSSSLHKYICLFHGGFHRFTATHETLQVWDDYYDRPAPQQVVYVAEAQPAPQPLPVTGERPASRMDDVGYA
eukprot:gene17680-12663_t